MGLGEKVVFRRSGNEQQRAMLINGSSKAMQVIDQSIA
jgi:hypothetical protein